MFLLGRLLVALEFVFSLKQDHSDFSVTWHVRIPGRITIKLLLHHFNHQVIGGDLKGDHIPPGQGTLMLMYSRLTLVYPLSLQEGQQSCALVMYATLH